MRRVQPVDLMLLTTVLLWALNVTVTKYMLQHGWKPVAYGTIRYFGAILLFWGFTWRRERSFRIARGDRWLVGLAALSILGNQLCFVYSLKLASASLVALLLAATPVFAGLVSWLFRIERLQPAFWAGAIVTMAGVALVALASGGGLGGSVWGAILGVGTAATWAVYSISIGPLMRRYSPYRISSVVLPIGWLPLAAIGLPQAATQTFDFGPLVWIAFAFAVTGPLFLTNIMWFTAVDRVGAARASLVNNLEPFFAVFFALILLSERLHPLEIAGGVLIFAGIALDRLGHRPRVEAAVPE